MAYMISVTPRELNHVHVHAANYFKYGGVELHVHCRARIDIATWDQMYT